MHIHSLPYNPSYFNNNNQWNDVSAMGLQGLPTSMSFQDTATQRILEAIGEVKENQSTIFQQLEENQTRLTTLEAEKTTAVEQPPVPRGQSFASRGRMSQANRTALRRGRDIEQPVVEVESETEGLEDLGKLPGVLSEGAQIARALLQVRKQSKIYAMHYYSLVFILIRDMSARSTGSSAV